MIWIGKRKASFLDNVDSPLEKKRMREDSEPVDEDEPGFCNCTGKCLETYAFYQVLVRIILAAASPDRVCVQKNR